MHFLNRLTELIRAERSLLRLKKPVTGTKKTHVCHAYSLKITDLAHKHKIFYPIYKALLSKQLADTM